MLHAVNRKKARLEVFRGAGQRVPLEDVVTSTVFGPLLFLDSEEAAKAVSALLEALGIPLPAWSGPHRLTLWPKKPTARHLRGRYVEPDAEWVDAAGISLILEVKWGAPLGEQELAAQWLSLTQDARANSRHLLIVLEKGPYRAAIEHDRRTIAEHCSLPWPLHPVSWRDLSGALRQIGRNVELNAGTRHWALSVLSFIRREDPLSLMGWDDLGLQAIDAVRWRFSRRLVTLPGPLEPTTWRYVSL